MWVSECGTVTGGGLREKLGVTDDMYGHVVETDGAVVRFMLGGRGDAETVDNVDAHIYLADGSHRYATFFTLGAVQEVLTRHARTGETGGGRYFWCSDQVRKPRRSGADQRSWYEHVHPPVPVRTKIC
ncbi:hypothetical protein [Micromonospora sp. WMMD980]|uniref:hypothetical protein n=1 Tax=Micromonospora sp. WMMD980 TaxID=3016088 RepID=UPI0024179D7A|nr:hypothetical protein [Micromonospora sp. WMMD980]MDG4804802.1 hypothetical protein [Micromonospora sp. WMMD980]